MAIRTDQFTNSLTVVDTVTANASLSLVPQGTGSVSIPGTGQNLAVRSQQINMWSANGTPTLTGNASIAPDGTTTATQIAFTTAGNGVYIFPSLVNGATATYSMYVKNVTSANSVRIGADFNPTTGNVIVDVTTGIITTVGASVTSSSITAVGNGWYRVVMSFAPTTSGISSFIIYNNSGVAQTLLVWGAQAELSSTVGTYVPTTASPIYGTPSLSFSGVSGLGLQSDGSLYASSAGTGNVRLYTNNVGAEQFRVSHTASAVNFLQVTGGTVGTTNTTISAQGSDSSVGITMAMKNNGSLGVTGAGGTNFLVTPVYTTGPAVNYLRVRGGPAGNAAILDVQGIETNAALALQSKGTGAIDLAAGSAGVNISNGTTVTAITLTSGGSGYTSVPLVTISAPTTVGGVQATAQALVYVWSNPITSAGTGYTVGNTLTAVGGTGTPYSFTVSTINGSGGVTGVSIVGYGAYTVTPTNPVTFTGGSGSGFTSNMSWIVGTPVTITNAGSGYVEQPSVTFSGGGTGLATAYAVVGTTQAIKTLGLALDFYSPSGRSFQVQNSPNSNPVNFLSVVPNSTGQPPYISSAGTDTNIPFYFFTKGTGGFELLTGGGRQLLVSNTASAVNYVQVTGSATSGIPAISAQGSDADIDLAVNAKSNRSVRLSNGNGLAARFYGGINSMTLAGSGAGVAPELSVFGSDTNIDLKFSTKGTGSHVFNTGNGKQFQIADATTLSGTYTLASRDITNNVQLLGVAGGAANFGLYAANGGSVRIYTAAGLLEQQLVIPPTTSAVNYVQIKGGATGIAPIVQALGSDTNIPLVLQPKGTGALQAQQTDSTATGGNARGINAVDWQTSRTAASQVASGQYSVIGGGLGNINNSTAGVIAGGAGNQVGGTYAGVLSGISNIANGFGSAIGAGYTNTAAGFFNFIGTGYTNTGTSGSAVTTQSGTMNGTTAVTLSASNASIKVGQLVIGTSITTFPHTYVAAVSGTSLTLSQVASGSSTSTLSFYTPHGVVIGGGNNIASGSYSFVGAGGDAGTATNRNVASGFYSTVTGGRNNTASGTGSFIGGGGVFSDQLANLYPQTASGIASSILGGLNNQATGSYSTVLGGLSNLANSAGSVAFGQLATTRSIVGNLSFSSCEGSIAYTLGVSQTSTLTIAVQTTDATATVLRSTTAAAGTTNQVILPNNSAYFFTGEVVAGVTGGGNTKGWTIEGVIKRGANAASTALVGTPTVTSMYADVGAATWTIALSADTTNGGLAVTFTGQLATTIRVVAQIRTTEMTF